MTPSPPAPDTDPASSPALQPASRLRSADALAGLFLLAVALVVLHDTRNLERLGLMGVGPGYFPALVAGALAALGGALAVVAALRPRRAVVFAGGLGPALWVTGGVVLFALLLQRAGLVCALFALILLAARASRTLSFARALLVAAVLSAVLALIFRGGLSLPFPVLPPFL